MDSKKLQDHIKTLNDGQLHELENQIQNQYLINSMNTSKQIIDVFEANTKPLPEKEFSQWFSKNIKKRIKPRDLSYVIRDYFKYGFEDYDKKINRMDIDLPYRCKCSVDDGFHIGYGNDEDGSHNDYMRALLNYNEKKALLDWHDNKDPITFVFDGFGKLALGIYFDTNDNPHLCISTGKLDKRHVRIFDESIDTLRKKNSSIIGGRVLGGGDLLEKEGKIRYEGKSERYGPIPIRYYEYIKAGLQQNFPDREIIMPTIQKPEFFK